MVLNRMEITVAKHLRLWIVQAPDYTRHANPRKTVVEMKPGTTKVLQAAILVGFALRVYQLAAQPLSWDEGWSIAMRSLPLSEINRITALDVHPPLYYYVLKMWPGLGAHELLLRFLSVVAGVVLIPATYVAGRVWCDERVGAFAACVAAFSPFLVYYSQVVRMFALCASLGVLAAYFLLKAVATVQRGFYLAFVCFATAALYTFYYSALVIAAVLVYALMLRPQQWRRLLMAGGMVALAYAPWLVYAVPAMLGRVGTRTGFSLSLTDVPQLLRDGLFGLVFAYGTGWVAVYGVLVVIGLGLVAAFVTGSGCRPLALPLLAIIMTLFAVAIGSQAHMFAARYVVAASPFLALALGWSLANLSQRRRWFGALAVVALLLSAAPTFTGYVYLKSYEVSGEFDPQADYRYLQDKARGDDIVFFNILSLAGHYERFRAEGDPPWSYVQRWDPVVEDLESAIVQRVMPAVQRHRRLWFVFYKGTVGANWDLKAWLDNHLYPAFGEWRDDTLYELYLAPTAALATVAPQLVFGQQVRLDHAAFTPRSEADDRVVVSLDWVAQEAVAQGYKVFVHLYDADGRLVAQHDAVPLNEERPTTSWAPGEVIRDRHGLWVPAGVRGTLRLVVGLYDPETGQRLELGDGADAATLGTVEITS